MPESYGSMEIRPAPGISCKTTVLERSLEFTSSQLNSAESLSWLLYHMYDYPEVKHRFMQHDEEPKCAWIQKAEAQHLILVDSYESHYYRITWPGDSEEGGVWVHLPAPKYRDPQIQSARNGAYHLRQELKLTEKAKSRIREVRHEEFARRIEAPRARFTREEVEKAIRAILMKAGSTGAEIPSVRELAGITGIPASSIGQSDAWNDLGRRRRNKTIIDHDAVQRSAAPHQGD